MNNNLYCDTTLVLSEDHGYKLDHMKCFCQSDNNGIFITEKSFLLQRAITHIENRNSKSLFSNRLKIAHGNRNSPALLISD